MEQLADRDSGRDRAPWSKVLLLFALVLTFLSVMSRPDYWGEAVGSIVMNLVVIGPPWGVLTWLSFSREARRSSRTRRKAIVASLLVYLAAASTLSGLEVVKTRAREAAIEESRQYYRELERAR